MMHEHIAQGGLRKHIDNIGQFRDDLELITRSGFKIYLAIDFHDIANFCFPNAAFLNIGKKSHLSDPSNRNNFYRRQISGRV